MYNYFKKQVTQRWLPVAQASSSSKHMYVYAYYTMQATLIQALCLVKVLTAKTKVMAYTVLAYSYSLVSMEYFNANA